MLKTYFLSSFENFVISESMTRTNVLRSTFHRKLFIVIIHLLEPRKIMYEIKTKKNPTADQTLSLSYTADIYLHTISGTANCTSPRRSIYFYMSGLSIFGGLTEIYSIEFQISTILHVKYRLRQMPSSCRLLPFDCCHNINYYFRVLISLS